MCLGLVDQEERPLRDEAIREYRLAPIRFEGEPFAGCLSMRRHRAGEEVWL